MADVGYTTFMTLCILGAVLFPAVILAAASIRIVPEDKRLVVFRLGRNIGEKGPGLVLLIPFVDRAERVDV